MFIKFYVCLKYFCKLNMRNIDNKTLVSKYLADIIPGSVLLMLTIIVYKTSIYNNFVNWDDNMPY